MKQAIQLNWFATYSFKPLIKVVRFSEYIPTLAELKAQGVRVLSVEVNSGTYTIKGETNHAARHERMATQSPRKID